MAKKHSTDTMTYTKIIDQVLIDRGLSRAWLSKQIGYTPQNLYYHWQNETLTTDMLDKIQVALNINLWDIKNGNESIASEGSKDYKKRYTISLTDKELKQIVVNQSRQIDTLEKQLAELARNFRDHIRMSKK